MAVKSKLTLTLEANDLKKTYDRFCKEVIGNKQIQAWILKECTVEFRDFDVKDIANNYIEKEPVIGNFRIESDKRESIRGLPTEDADYHEGKLVFDILYEVAAPDGDGVIHLIINVEAQNKYSDGYPLVSRGVVYACRNISSQFETGFDKSAYANVKKVYSIWICRNVPKYMENTITSYRITEHQLVGDVNLNQKYYDLLNVVMIGLSKDAKSETDSDAIRLLNHLLSETIKAEEKIEVLASEFDIPKDLTFEGKVVEMCNLSEGIFEQGITHGIEQGIEQTARNALTNGVALEVIATITGLDIRTIESLKDEMVMS